MAEAEILVDLVWSAAGFVLGFLVSLLLFMGGRG